MSKPITIVGNFSKEKVCIDVHTFIGLVHNFIRHQPEDDRSIIKTAHVIDLYEKIVVLTRKEYEVTGDIAEGILDEHIKNSEMQGFAEKVLTDDH